MSSPIDTIEEALSSLEFLRKIIQKNSSSQIRSAQELSLIKATAYSWLKTHKNSLSSLSDLEAFNSLDKSFSLILDYSDHHTSRNKYLKAFKDVKKDLQKLRSEAINVSPKENSGANENPPDFSILIRDEHMLAILNRRWEETRKCLSVGANLAATVMMGALLEALFLSKANLLEDKSILFKSKSSPKDWKTKKPLPLTDWTLNNYIEVAADINWIRATSKDASKVLRDYRNFIHPAKELTHKIEINSNDAELFWTIFKNLTEQIIKIKP